MALATL